MKYFLSVVCFVLVQWSFAQQKDFDFDMAWEAVYHEELRNLPKSARSKVDSIYDAAVHLQKSDQQVKALIYQSKYDLILEEESQARLVARYRSGITQLQTPYRNILENQLARHLFKIYQSNRWQIQRRSRVTTPSNDLNTWDKSHFFDQISGLFDASLTLPDSLTEAPLTNYKYLLDTAAELRKFRPYLIDLLAHNALEFYENNDAERPRPAQPFVMDDSSFFGNPADFSQLSFRSTDSSSYHLKALNIYQRLTSLHTTDNSPWAQTDLNLDRLRFVKDKSAISNSDQLYRIALRQLIEETKGDSAQVMPYLALARFEHSLGQQYQAQFNPVYQFKKVEAATICDSIVASFPLSEFTEEASQLKQSILSSELRLNIEPFLLPNQPTKMLATYTNHDQIYFQTYRIDPLEYGEFQRWQTDSVRQAKLSKLITVHSWQADLKNEKDYQQHSQEVIFPAHPFGAYLVMAFADDAKTKPQAFQMVQVTRMAIIQLHNPYRHDYQVIDRANGRPLAGVKAHFYASTSRSGSNINKHFTTNEQGMFSLSNKDWMNGVRIALSKGEDKAVLQNAYLRRDQKQYGIDTTEYNIEAQLFSDRAIYRPGQEMYFKAIVYKQNRQGSVVLPDEEVVLTLYDTNDEAIWEEDFTTNEFGSVVGKLTLPQGGLTGQYHLGIEAKDEDLDLFFDSENGLETYHYFLVEEYKRPKFEVDFEPLTGVYQFNDSVFVKGQATALAGSQVTGAKVSYTVERSIMQGYYNYGRSRFPFGSQQIAHGTTITDNLGGFTIPFKALVEASSLENNDITIQYKVSVSVTDINGETRENSTSVSVAKNPYKVEISGKKQYEKGTDSLSLPISINSLNGASQAIGGTVIIEKLKGPAVVKRNTPWEKPDYEGFGREEHEKLFPNWPYGSDNLPEHWPAERSMLTREIRAGAAAGFKLGGTQNWPSGFYRITFTSQPELGAPLKADHVFTLRAANATRLSNNARFEISLNKSSYEVGDTAIVSVGTAVRELGMVLTIIRESTLEHRSITLRDELRPIRIPIVEGDEAGIHLIYHHVADNDLQQGQLSISVTRKWPKLVLETGTFRNKLQPGSPEKWSFKVKGEAGEAVSAEMLASMYDASLDQFSANTWQLDPFYDYRRGFYGRLDDMNNFGGRNFRPLTFRQYYRPQNRVYEQWNWFGLDVRRPAYAQNNYLNELRFRRNARPMIRTEQRDLPTGTIQGSVFDEVGNPIVGATVLIAGTTNGSVVNKDGTFSLKAAKGQKFLISFLGYETFSTIIGDDNYFTITLMPDLTDLGEVVVVGYGTQEKKEISSSVVSIVPDEEVAEEVFLVVEDSVPGKLESKVAGVDIQNFEDGDDFSIRIRGNSTLSQGSTPLMIVDGVPVNTGNNLDPNEIASLELLKGEQATAIYGARAANGVIIITTKQEQKRQDALLAQVKARTNLKETAFFFPQLRTNEQGEVSFEFESPESLTRWKLQLLAHNKQLASALTKQTVVTQKELMLLPNAPRFLREGDQITFSAKVASLSLDTLQGFARLELFDAVSEKPVQSVIQSPQGNPTFVLSPKGNTELSWQLTIPDGLQAVRYRIVAVAGDFSDGEESVLPVLSKRMLVHESVPLWANARSTKTFELDKLSEQASTSLKHHRLTLQVTTNPVWEAIRSLPYLMEYPYECAEQTFARFYANQLGAHIIEQEPAIKTIFEKWKESGELKSKLVQNEELKAMLIEETPWLREAKSEAEQQKRLALLFDAERLAESAEESLNKLRDMQLFSGGFPWFAGSNRPNRYITQHIVTGLKHFMELTGNEDVEDIYIKGLDYLGKELVRDHQRLLLLTDFDPEKRYIGFYEVQYLYALSQTAAPVGNDARSEAIAFYKNQAYDYWPAMSLPEKAMIALFAHQQGDKKQVRKILKSLKEYAIESEELGTYWKENKSGWRNQDAPIATQALLIETFSKLEKDEDFVNGLRKWLLSHKRTNSWATTKATTNAINALLSFGADWTSPNDQVAVIVGSETVLSPGQAESGAVAGTGYMKRIWNADEIESGLGKVVIENNGKTQVWGGLHWQYFEDLNKITPSMGPLSAQKQLYLVKQTDRGEILEAINEESSVKIGDLVRVRIILKTDRSMEFIHMKDMRAAGFEPVNVLSGYKWQDGLGYYESTRDAATNFFIEYMPKGTFVFEYNLRANNAGKFSNGITSIQNMYAPEFSSHTEGLRVVINDE